MSSDTWYWAMTGAHQIVKVVGDTWRISSKNARVATHTNTLYFVYPIPFYTWLVFSYYQ